jgi:long-chain acyl-CoA synthetase
MQLSQQVDVLASALAAEGHRRGECIGLMAPTSFEWFIAAYAILKAGCCIVPIDVQLDPASLEHVIADSKIQSVFTTTELEHRFTSHAIRPILLDVEPENPNSYQRLLAGKHQEPPEVSVEDLAVLFYTSGTTGKPKGVPLQHKKLVHSLNVLLVSELVKPDDIALLPLPMHHVYPVVIGLLYTMMIGLEVILPTELTGPAITRAITEGNVSAVIGVPRLYETIVSGIKAKAKLAGKVKWALFNVLLSVSLFFRKRLGIRVGKLLFGTLHRKIGKNLRILASGGAKLDEDIAWTLEAFGWQVGIGYGLTETAPLLSFTSPGDGHIDGVGKPIAAVTVRIQPVASDSPKGVGEIQARGPNIFDGYHNLPEVTRAAFTEDGWFRTGDMGYIDKEGYLHVMGRVSTLMVLPGGEKAQPEDIEVIYQGHPFIHEAAVLMYNNKLVGIVVPDIEAIHAQGFTDIEWSVRRALAQQSNALASYQRLTDFAITRATLPRTRIGKLRRHMLTAAFEAAKSGSDRTGKPVEIAAMSASDKAIISHPAAKAVWEWLCALHPTKQLTLDTSPQLELGVDSLEWINTTLEIRQRAGVELSQASFSDIHTLRALLEAVNRAEAADHQKEEEAFSFEHPWDFLTKEQQHWLQPTAQWTQPLFWFGHKLNTALAKTAFRLEVEGAENVPVNTPFILCPNHVSYLDPFVVAAALKHEQLQKLYWGGWQGVVTNNAFNRAISRIGHAIPIDPHNAAVSSLAVGAFILRRGDDLVWFPEGRRSPDGGLQQFKPGIGLLLEHFQVPVIPVAIQGTFEALPTEKSLPRLVPIKVIFGRPMSAEELAAKGSGSDLHARITTGLHQVVKELGNLREQV